LALITDFSSNRREPRRLRASK
jgi:hypothetical protein